MKAEKGQSDKPEVKIGDTVLLADAPKTAILSIVDYERGLIALQRLDNGINIPFGFTSEMSRDQEGKWQIKKVGGYARSVYLPSPETAEVTIIDFIGQKPQASPQA